MSSPQRSYKKRRLSGLGRRRHERTSPSPAAIPDDHTIPADEPSETGYGSQKPAEEIAQRRLRQLRPSDLSTILEESREMVSESTSSSPAPIMEYSSDSTQSERDATRPSLHVEPQEIHSPQRITFRKFRLSATSKTPSPDPSDTSLSESSMKTPPAVSQIFPHPLTIPASDSSAHSPPSSECGLPGIEETAVESPVKKSRRRTSTSLTHSSIQESASLELSLGTTFDGSYFQPPKSFLEDTFQLFLMRKETEKRPKPQHQTSDIDPLVVGPNVVQTVLREHAVLSEQLRRDEQWQGERRRRSLCSCDVKKHPLPWTGAMIADIHSYSFLLHTQGLVTEEERLIWEGESLPGLRMYNVRMRDGEPWKRKAEQVLKYIDVELGIGDQTIYDFLYYLQPNDRMILLSVLMNKVVGLVVAEKLDEAYPVLLETRHYRELDSNSATRVKVGINKLWVHVSLRRNKLATNLCDAVRCHFDPAEVLQRRDIAFNNVSETGIKFATSFLNVNTTNNKLLLYIGKTGKFFTH